MSSENSIQQQAELSDANDKLIPEQQRRDSKTESDKKKTDNKKNIARNTAVLGENEGRNRSNSKSGLVEMSEKSNRARSSG